MPLISGPIQPNSAEDQTYAERIVENLVRLEALLMKVGDECYPKVSGDEMKEFIAVRNLTTEEAELLSEYVGEGKVLSKVGIALSWLNQQLEVQCNWTTPLFTTMFYLQSISVTVTYGGPTTTIEVSDSDVITIISSGVPSIEAHLPYLSDSVWDAVRSWEGYSR